MAGVQYFNTPSSQIRKQRNLFLGASRFEPNVTAAMTRSALGVWYRALVASTAYSLVADLDQVMTDWWSEKINYTNAGNPQTELSIESAVALYTVAGAALTSATLGVTQSVYPGIGTGPEPPAATAPTVTALIAAAAIPTAISADIVAGTVSSPYNSQITLSSSQILTEVLFTTPASCTVNFYGVLLNILYNQ